MFCRLWAVCLVALWCGGWRSLVCCSPWGCKESDTTKQLHFHFSLSFIGEGNATHSSVLAWRIPGMAEPAGLPSMGWYRVGQDWRDLAAEAAASKRDYATPRTASFRALAPAADHCWRILPQETLKHSKTGLAQSLWSFLVHTRFCLSLPRISEGYGFWF